MSSTSENSPAKESHVPPELSIGSRPLLIRFNDGAQESCTIMDPFDMELQEATRPELDDMVRGKQGLACLEGEWLFMLDDATGECFLLSLASLRKIQLPPLLLAEEEVESLSQCAISSPTPPDCTIVFSMFLKDFLLYCRPGDEEWWQLTDDTYELIMGDIVSSRGSMYVYTEMDTFVAIDVSMPSSDGVAIERRGIPHPSTMRWRCEQSLVESDGDVFLLQFYIHDIHNSEVVDVDIHLLDTSFYARNKVETIGDRTIFAGDNCVALHPFAEGGLGEWDERSGMPKSLSSAQVCLEVP